MEVTFLCVDTNMFIGSIPLNEKIASLDGNELEKITSGVPFLH